MALPRGDGQSELWPENWDPLEVAYFAGLFDGEGSVGVYYPNPSARRQRMAEQVYISNNDLRPLNRAKSLFGGSIHLHQPERPHGRANWRWYVSGRNAERFLAAILPHTIIKRPQIEVFLAYRLGSPGTGRLITHERREVMRRVATEISRLKREY